MLPPHTHRRILLLKENLETGGVHTVSDALAHALQAAGHRCDSQVIRATPLSRLWKAASQADVIIATHNFLPAYVAWLLGQWHRKPVITCSMARCWRSWTGPMLPPPNAAGYAGCIGDCLGWCLFPTMDAIPSWNSWVATRQHTSVCRSFPTRTLPGPQRAPRPHQLRRTRCDVATWVACHQKSALSC
jgi:hypothetical protein